MFCSRADSSARRAISTGCWPLTIGSVAERGHQRLAPVLLADPLGELCGGSRLARALQADHHDHHRRLGGEIQLLGDRAIPAAQHLDQLVVDDLDDLLARGDRAQHIVPDGLFGDRVDEAARDRQRHVGLEQRNAHLAHGIAHVLLAQRPAAAQAVKDGAEAIGQVVEHALPQSTREPGRPARNAKNAGGRNLVGQRANLIARSDLYQPAVCSPFRGKRRSNGGA
jgi:hypothetical protein